MTTSARVLKVGRRTNRHVAQAKATLRNQCSGEFKCLIDYVIKAGCGGRGELRRDGVAIG
jgi:hypothetical protein